MQMQKTVSLLVIPVVMAVCGPAAHAADDPLPSPQPAQAAVTPAGAVAPQVDAATPATTAAAAEGDGQPSFGVAMTTEQLDQRRGGDALVGQNFLNGTVADNVANKVVTGSNSISDGSFASSSGLPTVIQNTGSNVLIQNATVLNVRFGN